METAVAMLIAAAIGGLFVYGWPNNRSSAFGMPTGKVDDVFGVGGRSFRRALRRER